MSPVTCPDVDSAVCSAAHQLGDILKQLESSPFSLIKELKSHSHNQLISDLVQFVAADDDDND